MLQRSNQHGKPVVQDRARATETGTATPKEQNATTAGKPTEVIFDAASGHLYAGTEGKAIKATTRGKLKVEGYEGNPHTPHHPRKTVEGRATSTHGPDSIPAVAIRIMRRKSARSIDERANVRDGLIAALRKGRQGV
jgi:hypothetical protein